MSQQQFKISIPHFYCLEYIEGERTMTIEMDFREETPYLYLEMIKIWNPPHENEQLSIMKREQIFANIYKYLTEIRKFNIKAIR